MNLFLASCALAVALSTNNQRPSLVLLGHQAKRSNLGITSPQPSPPWFSVAHHLAKRMPNFGDVHAAAYARPHDDGFAESLAQADVLLVLGLDSDDDTDALQAAISRATKLRACIAHDCSAAVDALSFADCYQPSADTALAALWRAVAPWSGLARAERLHAQATSLVGRASTEDMLYALFFLVHAYVAPMPLVAYTVSPTWEKGFANLVEFAKMIRCCGPTIFRALTDPETKRAIDMLNACDMRDQVGSYRVITSFETPFLEAFSLCILQRNNCFNCRSSILDKPAVAPLATWRGSPLDERAAAAILYGHLDIPSADGMSQRSPWSWKVVVGANPAYDAFPCQHQIFYPGKAASSYWYDPVFLVETVDGKLVWRRRHYRVRPAAGEPGRWQLSTLDNGVISNERWTLVDAADDLSWVVFHYSGAASVVGQSYVGALLCTADGIWPSSASRDRIYDALRRCDLEPWELYGHGPDESFMWSAERLSWLAENPPPLAPLAPTEAEAADRERAAGFM